MGPARDEPGPHFVLYDEQANFVGRAKHVMLAPGHGPLSFPPVLARRARIRRLRSESCRPTSPSSTHRRALHRARRRDRVGQRVGQHLDIGARCLPSRDRRSRRRRTQRPSLPVRVPRDRCLRLATLRPADPVPRRCPTGTRPDRKTWLQTIEDGRKEGRFDASSAKSARSNPACRPATYVSSRDARGSGLADVTGVTAGTASTSPCSRSAAPATGPALRGAGPGRRLKLQSNWASPVWIRRTPGCAAWA